MKLSGLAYIGIALAVVAEVVVAAGVIFVESQGSYDHPIARGVFWFPRLLIFIVKRLFRFDV